jgi:hypothetical protein
VEIDWIRDLGFAFKVGGVDPNEVKFLAQRMAECSSDFMTLRYESWRFVYLAKNCDGDRLEESFLTSC